MLAAALTGGRVMRWTIAAVLVAITLLPAQAAELAGVKMEDSVEVEGQILVLNGLGLREKLWIDVYVAGLYLPRKMADAEEILASDTPRRMVMEFVRSVGKGRICGGWREGLANNSPDAPESVKQAFETLCGYMEDVAAGDRFVFTYVPGKGTEVRVKGAVKGTIPGKEFADALFACWIGPNPPGKGFKAGLLGG
ncbi:MAG: hypothetical protein D6718_07925 [Acidobacteria bacterium]|nr:MAG: hypothetical protein D6718_07925 [Acidobacteriota bacterium]